METKVILATFYVILGIYSMIVYLRLGRYNIFPKVITQKDIDTIIEKLKPYDVAISTVGFY